MGRAGGTGDEPLVDADRFLRVSDGLREAFAQLATASLTDSQRARWQRRLLAITNSAKHDLATAEERLTLFRADFARQVPDATQPTDDGTQPRD